MNTALAYFPTTAIINAITSTVLGCYLLIFHTRNPVARYLFVFCLAVAAWSYGYFFWQRTDNPVSALWWTRALMVGAIFTSVTYFHLVLVFLGLHGKRFYYKLLKIFYGLSFLWVLADLTPWFVARVEPRSYFNFWPVAGPLYIFFLISFVVHVLYASGLLLRKLRHSSGVEKMQATLLLIGIFLAFIGGSTNFPLWYGIDFAPWGNGAVAIYVILTVYAIVKYKFLDIRSVAAELFTGLFFIILLVDVFFSRTVTEFIFRTTAIVIMGVFGILLISSVRKEIEESEQVADLAQNIRRSNEQLQKLTKTLERNNLRLQELDNQKTEFLNIAAHQLRTPLSIIKSYLAMLQDGDYGRVSRRVREVLANMYESNQWLIRLADEFLNIANLEQGRIKYNFAIRDVSGIIKSVAVEMTHKAAVKGVALAWAKSRRPLPGVVCDEEKIRTVLFNFVDNAVKYTERGTVTVSAVRDKKGVALAVRDQGIGFDRLDEANLFQKFHRGNNVKGVNVNGTGLGLYVARKFVAAHGGRVWAKSAGLGRGSEFGFWIPLVPPPSLRGQGGAMRPGFVLVGDGEAGPESGNASI
ncbi:MAG: hypothetical protein HYV42_02060 [Candidatus Magasanikbacteria bacterium]|nr:hypothetical protein [Candidatus Magasanikbacteria bacterium]